MHRRRGSARARQVHPAVDPDNRLVARDLEAAWEKALTELAAAEAELDRRQAARPATLTAAERAAILALGDDLRAVWDAPSTTDKDRKQLLRTLLEEVGITIHRDHDNDNGHADLILRWKGGAITELTIPIKRTPQRRLRTIFVPMAQSAPKVLLVSSQTAKSPTDPDKKGFLWKAQRSHVRVAAFAGASCWAALLL